MKTKLINTPYGRKTTELLCRAMDALEREPNLLAALETCIKDLTRYTPKDGRGYKEPCFKYIAGGWDMWDCNCSICIARAAIAKATGKAQP